MGNKIFITSHLECDGEKVWQVIQRRLLELYEKSDKRYELVHTPEHADIILVGGERWDEWCEYVFDNAVVDRYPGKAFTIHDGDYPTFLHHGLYSSARRTILSYQRVRTGSYTLYSTQRLNHYILKHTLVEEDFQNKEFLFSFVGRNSHPIRQRIFSMCFGRPDIFIEDTSHFDLWKSVPNSSEKNEFQISYYKILLKSKFALCPRGAGTGSMRLFEAMKLGVSPVIISDGWILPEGPNWSDFSIFIKEKDIEKVEQIIKRYEEKYKQMGQAAKIAYDQYFDESVYFNYVVENCLSIIETQKIPEWFYRRLSKNYLRIYKLKDLLRIKTRFKALLSSCIQGKNRILKNR